MQREPGVLLWDVKDSIAAIRKFIGSATLEQFSESDMLQSAVERKLIIVGEALGQAKRLFPELEAEISDFPQIIGLRNHLVHAYHLTLNEELWKILQHDLPKLESEVEKLLSEKFPL